MSLFLREEQSPQRSPAPLYKSAQYIDHQVILLTHCRSDYVLLVIYPGYAQFTATFPTFTYHKIKGQRCHASIRSKKPLWNSALCNLHVKFPSRNACVKWEEAMGSNWAAQTAQRCVLKIILYPDWWALHSTCLFRVAQATENPNLHPMNFCMV